MKQSKTRHTEVSPSAIIEIKNEESVLLLLKVMASHSKLPLEVLYIRKGTPEELQGAVVYICELSIGGYKCGFQAIEGMALTAVFVLDALYKGILEHQVNSETMQ